VYLGWESVQSDPLLKQTVGKNNQEYMELAVHSALISGTTRHDLDWSDRKMALIQLESFGNRSPNIEKEISKCDIFCKLHRSIWTHPLESRGVESVSSCVCVCLRVCVRARRLGHLASYEIWEPSRSERRQNWRERCSVGKGGRWWGEEDWSQGVEKHEQGNGRTAVRGRKGVDEISIYTTPHP